VTGQTNDIMPIHFNCLISEPTFSFVFMGSYDKKYLFLRPILTFVPMKSKLVIWGKNPHGKRVLLAISLNEQENKVETLVFHESVVTEELENEVLKKWKEDDSAKLDIEHQVVASELSMLDNILPEGYTTDKEDVIKRAQTEWHFIVLSTRLYNVYKSEVDELRDKIDELESYQQQSWDELKTFWDKIQIQIYEKNLLRSHSQELKELTNTLFESLKEKRKNLDKFLQDKSKTLVDDFQKRLEDIEAKMEKGLSLQPLFEDLRKLQAEINSADLQRDHRRKIWNRIDAGFKKIKEMRFGEASDAERNQVSRLENRINGLDGVIKRMQQSVKLDQREIEKLAKPSEGPFGILEEQLKEAKRKMITERLQSKQGKLDDMLKTYNELKERIQKLRDKDESKRLIDEAKKAAEQKIAEEIKQNAEQRKEEEDKLMKAAEELQESRIPKKARERAANMSNTSSVDSEISDSANTASTNEVPNEENAKFTTDTQNSEIVEKDEEIANEEKVAMPSDSAEHPLAHAEEE
jgi:hypothetical protein